MLLVAGGVRDPNLDRVATAARRCGVETREARFGADRALSLSWFIETGEVIIDGELLRPSALFYRRDVFNTLNEPDPRRRADHEFQASAWHALFRGWAAADESLRIVNRGFVDRSYNKPLQLALALRCGLAIPRTTVTNDAATLRALAAGEPCIAKPVNGGQLTSDLSDTLARFAPERTTLPAPAFAQNRLDAPEYRVFLIGQRVLAFTVASPHLDYRADHASTVVTLVDPHSAPVVSVAAPLKALAGRLGLDFCAADFKSDPRTGELVFLEVNEQPMFARFDRVADGAIGRALVRTLMGEAGAGEQVALAEAAA